MNKQQYVEFHRYLAMLIYEYKNIYSKDISDESRNKIEEILKALEKVMKICIIDGSDK